MKVKIEQLKTHSDMRGFIFEPISEDLIDVQKNIHVVISAPDAVRGNHYHLNGTETIVVVGPALLRFKEGNDIHDFEVPSRQVYKFVIPPKVAHAFKNIGKKDNFLVAFNTFLHTAEKPDVVSEILINK